MFKVCDTPVIMGVVKDLLVETGKLLRNDLTNQCCQTGGDKMTIVDKPLPIEKCE